ncbi:phage tail tape measure protein [Achromobacter denitrificans]|uniref:phage tail tape measure protein n=1 Tax=Achromobacter denitrificans TaxID=32002 RepID=UPI000F678FE2|nr:phage tail tape measure protein [Achromobacter denitrificans]RSE76662.1 phage tail tape measure protein [Achromobacter denitrificans]
MDKALQLRVIAALQDKLSGPLNKIKGSSAASAQGVADLRSKLKALDTAQREVGKFREVSRGLQTTRAELTAAQQRVAGLAQQMQTTTAPTRAMTREFDRAVRAAQQLKEKHGQQSMELQRLRENLGRAGISTSNLSRDERGLRQRIDQTSQALDRQTAKLQAAAKHQQRLAAAKDRFGAGRGAVGAAAGTGAAALATGGGLLYAESKFVMPGIDFDASMSKVQALARLEKTSEEMNALRKQARDLGAETMFSAGQAADAQGFLAMAGFTPKAILAAMPGMLSLAKAGDTDLAQTADIGSNILTGFKLPADQMGRVGDVLTGAFTRSNTSLYMLGETMKYVAPVAAGLGVKIETAAAMAGKLGDAGIQGSMAGTAMRAILGRLAAPPKAAADALAELGVKTKDAKGNLRDLPTILAEIDKKTQKMGSAKRAGYFKHIAGEEAFSALQVLTDQAGQGELQKFVKTLETNAGEADKTAATMADNMRGSLDELSSAWEDLGIQVYEQHDGALRKMVIRLADLIGSVKNWAAANPELASTLTALAAGLAVLIAGFGALTLVLASILGPFIVIRYGLSLLGIQAGGLFGLLVNLARGGFGLLANAIMFVGRLLLANPIALAITAIGLAAYAIYRYWEPISGFFSGLWSGITTTFNSALQWLSGLLAGWDPLSVLGAAWGAVSGFFGQIWQSVAQVFDGGLAGIGAQLLNWSPLGLLYQPIAAALSSLGVALPGNFTEFGSMLVQGLINGITSMAGALKDSISNMGSGVIGWFKEKLGIHSPSRVFADMGGFVSEGAAVGIKAQQPEAMKAAQALAASVALSGAMLAPGALAAPAGIDADQAAVAARFDMRTPMATTPASVPRQITVQGDTVNITIQGAAMSQADLQRAVETALRRVQADKEARIRSAYIDRD